MNILLLSILIFGQLGLYDQFNRFSNEIHYPIKNRNNTYKFYLEIEEGRIYGTRNVTLSIRLLKRVMATFMLETQHTQKIAIHSLWQMILSN